MSEQRQVPRRGRQNATPPPAPPENGPPKNGNGQAAAAPARQGPRWREPASGEPGFASQAQQLPAAQPRAATQDAARRLNWASWLGTEPPGGGIVVSDTEPESPATNSLWFDWTGPRLSLRYDYETWIELAPNMETPTGPPKEPPTPQPPGPGPGPGPGPTVPWASDLTYSVPFTTVTFMPGDGTGKIPLTNLGGWDPAYQADFTDELLYLGPNRPTSPANQVIRLFATFTPPGTEVEVHFDGFGPGTPASNKVTEWGYDSGQHGPPGPPSLTITGSNSTGNPIQLRLTKA